MIALLAWAETGLATDSSAGHGPQCHATMPHMSHATAAAMHGMSAGCCPRHVSSKSGCPSHPGLMAVPAYRPDCCTVSGQPSRLHAFLIVSGATIEEIGEGFAGPLLAPSTRVTGWLLAVSPPFTKSVFETKADLRI